MPASGCCGHGRCINRLEGPRLGRATRCGGHRCSPAPLRGVGVVKHSASELTSSPSNPVAFLSNLQQTALSEWERKMAEVKVPNLVGSTQAVAETALNSAKLVVTTVTMAHPNVPAGNVIGT